MSILFSQKKRKNSDLMTQLKVTANYHKTDLNRNDKTTDVGDVAVLGSGMLRNNTLLPVLLGSNVTRWYPWYRFTTFSSNSPTEKKFIHRLFYPLYQQSPQNFAGWGQKKSYQRAKKMAKLLNRPLISVEDGFLRSITSGITSRYGCSVVVDDLGIYFDLTQASRLENHIIQRTQFWSLQEEQRAKLLIDRICNYRLSKYNSVLGCPILSEISEQQTVVSHQSESFSQEHILLIDQVKGDASIKGAGADDNSFKKMLKIACKEHPRAHIWIKAHPASKVGYLNDSSLLKKLSKKDKRRVHILAASVNPIELIKQVSHVYTVSSHMGFEALMLGKTVHCFGMSWYAGWGLTDDTHVPQKMLRLVKERRHELVTSASRLNGYKGVAKLPLPKKLSVFQLFYAAYIDYSRYADPASGQSCQIEQVIEWLNTNRHWFLHLSSKMTIFEFSRWKINFVKDFLQPTSMSKASSLKVKLKPKFRTLQKFKKFKVDLSHDIIVWGLAASRKIQHYLQQMKDLPQPSTKVWCMEDGFIRSNGLGATLLEPLSVVIDSQGIYYDATKSSDLEDMLASCPFLDKYQQQRVENLQKKLLMQRVSKYHVGKHIRISIPSWVYTNKVPIILVVGQVEDDLSVQNCGSRIQTNSALLQRVRLDNPNAYLIFKPHPDVEAGLRVGKVEQQTLKLADDVANNVAIPDCLEVIDEVHTISSLTGFEALLRNKKVTCYGLPFYAGWGLTKDIDTDYEPKSEYVARRQQKRLKFLQQQKIVDTGEELSIEQLIYCTLIKYPMYRLPNGFGLAQVEQIVDYLYPQVTNDYDKKVCAKGEKFTMKRRNHINKKIMQLRLKLKQLLLRK